MSICAKCAEVRHTSCCLKRDIVLTHGDIERIHQFTHQTDFFEYRIPADPDYLDQDDDPNWLTYTMHSNGSRRVLKHLDSGNCSFLTGTGCILPKEIRPLICRMHPYNYTEQGITGVCPECPQELLEQGQTILDALDMSYPEAERWWLQLYSELRQERVQA